MSWCAVQCATRIAPYGVGGGRRNGYRRNALRLLRPTGVYGGRRYGCRRRMAQCASLIAPYGGLRESSLRVSAEDGAMRFAYCALRGSTGVVATGVGAMRFAYCALRVLLRDVSPLFALRVTCSRVTPSTAHFSDRKAPPLPPWRGGVRRGWRRRSACRVSHTLAPRRRRRYFGPRGDRRRRRW